MAPLVQAGEYQVSSSRPRVLFLTAARPCRDVAEDSAVAGIGPIAK